MQLHNCCFSATDSAFRFPWEYKNAFNDIEYHWDKVHHQGSKLKNLIMAVTPIAALCLSN